MGTKDWHLGSTEAQAIVAGELEGTEAHEIIGHLGSCGQCRRAVIVAALSTGGELLKVRRPPFNPSGTCPEREDLLGVAAGVIDETRAKDLLQHAATCDSCGQFLKEYQETFSDEITPEEMEQISALPLASSANRARLAEVMSRPAVQLVGAHFH